MSFLKSRLQKLLQPAEDPRQSAHYTDERQREMLVKIRMLLVDIEQSRQQLTAKTAVLAQKMDRLEAQACKSLKNGREDLARRCLQQQHKLSAEQQAIQAQIQAYDQKEQKLRQAEYRLLTQIEAYLSRCQALQRRQQQSQSQVVLNKGLKKLFAELSALDDLIELAETETDTLEARASILSDDVETRLLLIPIGTVDVASSATEQQIDLELTRLRAQIEEK